jgi:hypothetical protein
MLEVNTEGRAANSVSRRRCVPTAPIWPPVICHRTQIDACLANAQWPSKQCMAPPLVVRFALPATPLWGDQVQGRSDEHPFTHTDTHAYDQPCFVCTVGFLKGARAGKQASNHSLTDSHLSPLHTSRPLSFYRPVHHGVAAVNTVAVRSNTRHACRRADAASHRL